MHNHWIKAVGLAALAQQIVAFPSSFTGVARSPTAYDAVEAETWKRQTGTDSSCDVGDGTIVVNDKGAQPGQSPQAFTILFDAVRDDLCGAIGCFGDSKYVTANSASEQVCISVQGNWQPEERGFFIQGSRELFDRTVTYGYSDPSMDFGWGAVETSADKIFLNNNDGSFIQISLTLRDNGGGQCPGFVDAIASVGALAGPAGPFFGVIGLLCNNVPTGRTI